MIAAPRVYSFVLSTVLVLSGAAAVRAEDSGSTSKIDRALRAALASGAAAQRVIVMTEPGHGNEIKTALQGHGDVVSGESDGGAITAIVHSADVRALARHPYVQSVSADAVVKALGQFSRTSTTPVGAPVTDGGPMPVAAPSTIAATAPNVLRQTLGLTRSAAPGSVDGHGVVVALIDSGLSPNADLPLSRIAGFYDFTNMDGGQPGEPAPYDDFGHGTHVAGLLGSSGALTSSQYQGVAPAVRFAVMKVLDAQGQGTTSTVIKAIDFAVARRQALGIRIINLSLGHPIYAPAKYDPLVQAVERAVRAGLVVVVAAGNNGLDQDGSGQSGYAGINSPANAPSSIAVGAVDTGNTVARSGDSVAPFSSRGPTWFDATAKPDIVAPGLHLVSDTDVSSYLYNHLPANQRVVNGNPMLDLTGTSMAAPVAAGVAALVLDANGALMPNAVKAILEYTAIRIPDADYLTQGAGEVNAGGAIALAGAIDTGARMNSWWLATGVPGFTIIGGAANPWSHTIIWDNAVFGGALPYYKNIIWTTNIIWGTHSTAWRKAILSGSNIVWGSNIIWGTLVTVKNQNIVWGTSDDDNIIWGTNLVWNRRVIGQRTKGGNIIWGTEDGDNIIWGTMDEDNIVWGTYDDQDNIIWGTWDGDDNIIWGTTQKDTLVDGTSLSDDNIIWGTSDDDNIVWGTDSDLDNIVWGTSTELGPR